MMIPFPTLLSKQGRCIHFAVYFIFREGNYAAERQSLHQQGCFRNANVSVLIRFLSTKSCTSWDAYRVNRLPLEPWQVDLRSEGLRVSCNEHACGDVLFPALKRQVYSVMSCCNLQQVFFSTRVHNLTLTRYASDCLQNPFEMEGGGSVSCRYPGKQDRHIFFT